VLGEYFHKPAGNLAVDKRCLNRAGSCRICAKPLSQQSVFAFVDQLAANIGRQVDYQSFQSCTSLTPLLDEQTRPPAHLLGNIAWNGKDVPALID
jgi:hypothetical protein